MVIENLKKKLRSGKLVVTKLTYCIILYVNPVRQAKLNLIL